MFTYIGQYQLLIQKNRGLGSCLQSVNADRFGLPLPRGPAHP